MFVIEVIPITKTIGVTTLSYFTAKEVPVGAVVDVPLRSKIVQGIVISVRQAADIKSEIKTSTFALKKLDKIKSVEFFSKEFMETAKTAADYYATSVGGIIDTLAPDYILKNVGKLKIDKKGQENAPENSSVKKTAIKYAVQGDDEERYGTWKSLIRQEFAKKKSVFFLLPTIEEAEYAFSLLEKGIEGFGFLLHGSLTPKTIVDTWNTIMKEEHPVAVIATGGFLMFPRKDIETIVIERESSRSYKIQRRPYLDIRTVAEMLAEKKGMKLFVADNFLRIETLWRADEREGDGEFTQASPFKFRSLSTAQDTLVDMKQLKSKPLSNSAGEEKVSFKILSPEVEQLIARTKDNSEQMMILATRRGLAPSTICGDCQTIVTCNNCSAPVVLHTTQSPSKNGSGSDVKTATFFMCHRCGERRSTEEYCKMCGSWKLGTIGIGIDLVQKKIEDSFPDVSIFKIDSDATPNDKSAHAVLQKFRAKPGSILIGTEMMLNYMHDKVENSAIISLDSLFSLPDFRIQEKILYMLIRMRALTTRDFVVQTRKSDEKVFEYGLKGNMSDFYRTALDERKNFKYPPFSMLVKITLEGKKDEIVKEMEAAQKILEPFEVEVFPAFTHTVKGNFVLHGLIRLPKEQWVDMNLIEKLRSLSPAVTVKIDPETLL